MREMAGYEHAKAKALFASIPWAQAATQAIVERDFWRESLDEGIRHCQCALSIPPHRGGSAYPCRVEAADHPVENLPGTV